MKRASLVLAALLSLLSLWPASSLAQQATGVPTGVIRGRVINGTAGGGPVEGLRVHLDLFQDQHLSETREAVTGAGGRFEFANLPVGDTWAYRARVPYQGVSYTSGSLAPEPGQADAEHPRELAVEVMVYEATTSSENVIVSRAHILVTVSGSGLADMSCSVTELYILNNSGDRTYVGPKQTDERQPTSSFMLPRTSHDLTLDDGALGGRFLAIEGGLADTEPNWPGTTRVMYSYTVDQGDGGCDLSRQVLQPIADLNLLVTDTGVRVESTRLTFEGKREAQGQFYVNHVAQNLAAGERLDLVVKPAQEATPAVSARTDASSLPWIVLGTLLALLALVYPFWRQRVREAAVRERSNAQELGRPLDPGDVP